ncbi:CLUMA_CG016385, isoform A [Clunio marinus]|uniref:RING-type E3 ubiquitin transferase n=1 Tax=Clunio marinus TaxID=568069 RepID=A0A1J1IRX0_9DIPT|nr:CLUMA_CG016385, isoform A [Clunio marinus]
MAGNIKETKSPERIDENACVVCFKTCLIYSIGACNHAVCFECSARMRCICLQNECPICRQDLPKVVFTKTIAPFATLDRDLRSGLYEKKYRIAFADLDIQKAFYRLLEHRCPECDHTPFIEFNKLKEHVRKVHELFYCEICTDNLKIFSSTRRCYTRQQLATHRRVGDVDDKSHKGHPRCEYCELRFLDKDELFRHLRREHYFCHLCDADGINLFYGAITEMRDHFKSEHFLCEEEDCANEQLTAVYRSEIDLRAHVAMVHSKGMTKAAVKQARTLELEFFYGSRGRSGAGHENGRHGRIRTNDTQREFDGIPEQQTIVQQAPIQIDAKNEEQFPSLAGPSKASSSFQPLGNTTRHMNYGTAGLARTKENFPALGNSSVIENEKVTKSKMPSASSLLKASSGKQKNAFKLQSTSSNKSTPSSATVKNNSQDFPALSKPLTSMKSMTGPAASSFFKVTSKPTSRQTNSSSTLSSGVKNITEDFPSLSTTSKKNRNKKDLLEDMVLPESSLNKNLVSSKHRNLVDDYVSMASAISKVQTVQQKDIKTDLKEMNTKIVPKLNSVDNFPTLGVSTDAAVTAPQWITIKGNNKQEQNKKNKKVNEMPAVQHEKTKNGYASMSSVEDKKKTSKQKINQNDKENNKSQAMEVLTPPPPGFSQASKHPPPGFNQKNLTTSEMLSDYIYLPPTNASKRNQALVSEFQKALTPELMQEFRLVSQMFRDGNYFPKSYYESCEVVLGEKFNSIFPELLALLPDIEKQQSLFQVHLEKFRQSDNSDKKSKKKNKMNELEACATCKQVLISNDLRTHLQSHSLENNFPQL